MVLFGLLAAHLWLIGWVHYRNFEYKVFGEDTKRQFADAAAVCGLVDAEFASIRDLDENTFLSNYLFETAGVNELWIGGRLVDGDVVWENGRDSPDYEIPYLTDEPDGSGSCIMYDVRTRAGVQTGLWSDRACTAFRAFLCARSTHTSSTSTSYLYPTQDLLARPP